MDDTTAQANKENKETSEKEEQNDRKRTESENSNPENVSPEVEFKPIVSLPLVETKSLEEDEKELLKIRAKLYRYETDVEPPEWKERGLGDVKFLQHPETSAVRILMRREKTLKICANHYVTAGMKLSQHANNEKAFVWSTVCDFADGESKSETFCIRFGSIENAQKFKATFDQAKEIASSIKGLYDKLDNLNLAEESSSDEDQEEPSEENKENSGNSKNVEVTQDSRDGKEVESGVTAAGKDDATDQVNGSV